MPTRRMTSILFVALAACAPLSAQPSGCPQGSPSVSPTVGTICGKVSSINIPEAGPFTANAYLGIPYAQPPVGALRWQNPVAPNSWTVPLQATQFGNQCPQPGDSPGSACTTPNQNEDCLYLNVWTPREATSTSKLPVMVFIHGGAFTKGSGGSSISDLYDGTYLVSQKVVVVTFNYRLGVLGFLATPDMQGGAGNFGFLDQIEALKWVQKNIASFGGDPSQVLLFGESAGAMSVGLHALSSTQSAGLFKAALMESNPLGIPYKTLDQARTVGKKYSRLLNCSNLECLQQKRACDLVDQEDSRDLSMTDLPLKINIFHWTPVIDGSLISGQPMANAANLKVPMLMGTNQDEGLLFAALRADLKINGFEISKPVGYAAFLGLLFGPDALTIGENRYYCLKSPCTEKLANVFTDYMFTCPNRQFASRAGNARKLYMYLFNQTTNFNFWENPNQIHVPACKGKVCHADELPYVFNTAWALGKKFETEEEKLSQTIGGLWASFAKSQSPGSAWPLFNPNKSYQVWRDFSSSIENDPLNAIANCTLWDNIGYQPPTAP